MHVLIVIGVAWMTQIFGPYVLKSPGKRHEELEGSQSVISMSPVYAVTKEIIDFHPQVFAPCNLHRVKHAFAGQDETVSESSNLFGGGHIFGSPNRQ